MNEIKEQLIDYVEKALQSKDCLGRPRKDWAFAAINFSNGAGLITQEDADELYQKYDIL